MKPFQGINDKQIFLWSLVGGRTAALLVANFMAPQLMIIMSIILCLGGGAALWILGPFSLAALEVKGERKLSYDDAQMPMQYI